MIILYEYEAKKVLEECGIPTEASVLLSEGDAGRVRELAALVPGPYVVKAQLRQWGRGRAGLVRFADSLDEVEELVRKMLGSEWGGERVRYVMVSERVRVLRELYVSMIVGGSPPGVLLLASGAGGVEVEERARSDLLAIRIDPAEGLRDYMVRRAAKHLGLQPDQLAPVLKGMYRALWEYSLLLVELNPLAVTDRGLVAIDRKAVADEDSGNPKLSEFVSRYESELGDLQREARKWGFAAVPLDGDVAVVGNGAGLTMATLDAVADAGGKPGLFLDLGGGASAERVKVALKLALSQPGIRRVLVNVLGGITRCDEVARGLAEALREAGRSDVKVVVRLSGFMEEEGRRILEEAGLRTCETLEEAVREVVS